MKNTRLAVVLFACMAMLCVAATSEINYGGVKMVSTNGHVIPIDSGPLQQFESTASTTKVPVHVLPNADVPASPWIALIGAIVPVIIAGLKIYVPKIPSWTLPYLAPILGALMDLVVQLSGTNTYGVAAGAVLGGLGVCVREMHDQVSKRMTSTPPPAPDPAPAPPPEPSPPAPKPVETPPKPA